MSKSLSAGDLLMQADNVHSTMEPKSTGVDAKLSKLLKKTFLSEKEDKISHSNNKSSTQKLSKTDYFTAFEYNMSRSCMGHALIINNEHFDDKLGMNTRHGTKVDGENLKETLRCLGYTVHYKYNATFQEMKHVVYLIFLIYNFSLKFTILLLFLNENILILHSFLHNNNKNTVNTKHGQEN